MVNGLIQQIQAGDTLLAAVSEVDTIPVTNGESSAITIGMPVYISAADTVKKAKADASGTMDVIGLVTSASIAASGTGSAQSDGLITSSDWTAVIGATTLTAGARYYLSPTTAGQMTTTAPTTTGQFVLCLGKAKSTTDFEIAISTTPVLL